MKLIPLGLLTVSILMTGGAFGQDADAGRNRPEGQRRTGGLGAGGLENLTEEQRAAVRVEMQAMNEASRELRGKQRAAQNALRDAVFAEKIDEAAIRAKAAEVGKIEGDLAVIRARHMAKLRGKLPAESFERLKNSPMAGGMGMGGGFGPGEGGLRRGAGPEGGAGPDGDRPRRRPQQQ